MKRAILILLLSGCVSKMIWEGADPATGEKVVVRSEDMPAGHSFSGKYDSTKMGKPLELTQTGGKVTGKWSRQRPPDNDCLITGNLVGEAEANHLEFDWTEDFTECGQGTVRGKGWALYRVLEGNDRRPRLYGKRGLEGSADNEGPWLGISMTETSTGG